MKSINKLYDAINCIGEEMNEYDVAMAKSLIREFIIDNTEEKKKTKFSCSMFTSDVKKDGMTRPSMCCVYHDNENKVAVATNGIELYTSESEYIPTDGNCLRNAYGEDPKESLIYVKKSGGWKISEITTRFPDWKKVIPTNTVHIGFREDIEQVYNESMADAKGRNTKKADEKVIINLSSSPSVWMTARHVKFIIDAGIDGWVIREDFKGGLLKKWDGKMLMLMPFYITRDVIHDAELFGTLNEERRYLIKPY